MEIDISAPRSGSVALGVVLTFQYLQIQNAQVRGGEKQEVVTCVLVGRMVRSQGVRGRRRETLWRGGGQESKLLFCRQVRISRRGEGEKGKHKEKEI